jgi:hypothetical protein
MKSGNARGFIPEDPQPLSPFFQQNNDHPFSDVTGNRSGRELFALKVGSASDSAA